MLACAHAARLPAAPTGLQRPEVDSNPHHNDGDLTAAWCTYKPYRQPMLPSLLFNKLGACELHQGKLEIKMGTQSIQSR